MLKQNKNNRCFLILAMIMVTASVLVMFPLFLLFLVIIYFKSSINIEKVLKSLGVYDCLKLEKIKKVPWEQNNKYKDIETKKTYYDDIKEKKKRKGVKNKKKQKLEEIKKSGEESKFDFKGSYEKSLKLKNNNYSYNNGKSIWDDYESVLDKINKK